MKRSVPALCSTGLTPGYQRRSLLETNRFGFEGKIGRVRFCGLNGPVSVNEQVMVTTANPQHFSTFHLNLFALPFALPSSSDLFHPPGAKAVALPGARPLPDGDPGPKAVLASLSVTAFNIARIKYPQAQDESGDEHMLRYSC